MQVYVLFCLMPLNGVDSDCISVVSFDISCMFCLILFCVFFLSMCGMQFSFLSNAQETSFQGIYLTVILVNASTCFIKTIHLKLDQELAHRHLQLQIYEVLLPANEQELIDTFFIFIKISQHEWEIFN